MGEAGEEGGEEIGRQRGRDSVILLPYAEARYGVKDEEKSKERVQDREAWR